MSNKIYDLCVKTGEYQTRDGQVKKQMLNIDGAFKRPLIDLFFRGKVFNPIKLFAGLVARSDAPCFNAECNSRG